MLKWLASVLGAIIAGLAVFYITQGIEQRVATSDPETNQPTLTSEIKQPSPAPIPSKTPTEIDLEPEPEISGRPPKTLAKVDLGSEPEINIPILTTGTSESQLVSTLGKPNREKAGWQPNSKELVYYDVIQDQVSLTYQVDDTGKIRQTDIAISSTVSLGWMQYTLAKMLGGESPAGIKDKLRRVYNRQMNLSNFEVNGLRGFVKRDSKDRIYISVWEKGFQ